MKFLVIRFSSLGDIIITTAFLETLKNLYPQSKIYYATRSEFAEIIGSQPFVDKIFALKKKENIFEFAKQLKNERFDCIFDLHKNPKSLILSALVKSKKIKRVNKHTLYRHKLINKKLLFFIKNRKTKYNIDDEIKLISENTKDARPHIYITKTEIEAKKPVIGIAPGAKWPTKRWPMEYYGELVKMIAKNTHGTVMIFGSKEEAHIANYIEKEYKNTMNFAGKLSVKETAAYMANCQVVVTNDSALMHLANAIDVPVVAIFGPTVSGFGFYPKGKNIVLEDKNLQCRPCSLHGSSKCPKADFKCMKNIKPEMVLKAVKKMLEDYTNEL